MAMVLRALARPGTTTRVCTRHRRCLPCSAPGLAVAEGANVAYRAQQTLARGAASSVLQVPAAGLDALRSKAAELLATSSTANVHGDSEVLSAVALEDAVALLKLLPRGDKLASDLRRRVAASLEAALPELLRRGACLSTVLHLPLMEKDMEQPLKALVLLLARRLRRQRGVALPAAELPRLPALLQRLGVQDHELFDDFCMACAESLGEMGRHDLTTLFRGAEDYKLLHPSKGTALSRLVAALEARLEDGKASIRPTILSALCHSVLAVRSRPVCLPLLERLRDSLRPSASGVEEAAEVLGATAELHRAIGVPPDVLVAALDHCRQELRSVPSDRDQDMQIMPALLRPCGLCWWSAGEASTALFEALLQRLMAVGLVALPEQVLRACRHLPAALRLRLAERLLPDGEVRNLSSLSKAQAASCWLSLLHDLPALEVSQGRQSRAVALAEIVQVLIDRILKEDVVSGLSEGTSATTAQELPATAWVAAYLAAANTGHCLRLGEGSTSDTVMSERLASLAEQVLERLETLWPQLTAREAEEIFRVDGDSAGEISRRALAHLNRVSDVRTQIAILHAASRVPGISDAALASAYGSLHRRIGELKTAAELNAAEAALRKRQPSKAAQELHAKLLAEVRDRLFQVTVEADVVWKRTPARGYIRYVERCVAKGRLAAASSTVAEPQELKAAAAAAPPADAAPLPTDASIDTVVPKEEHAATDIQEAFSFDERGEPRSRVAGVTWHRGMGSWEVRIEARGYRFLGGYFTPEDDTAAGLERALLAAIEKRRSLLEDPPRRWYAPR